MAEDDFIGGFEADDFDADDAADDILFAGDPDFDMDADEADIMAGEFGRAKRRRKRRRKKRARLIEQILMPFTRTAVAAGTPATLTVEPDRDCRLLDLRVIGTILATGVEDPGIAVTGLTVGGAQLFNAAGTYVAANMHPRDRRAGAFNCVIKKAIRASQVISLNVTNLTAGAISVDAALLVRCKVS